MTNGLAPVASQNARVGTKKPAAVASNRSRRRPGPGPGVETSTRPTTKPTARKASVKDIPSARTTPDDEARASPLKEQARPACAARASAVAATSGNAVSATGWNRTAAGTSGQSAADDHDAGADRLARARAYRGTTVAAQATRVRAPVS